MLLALSGEAADARQRAASALAARRESGDEDAALAQADLIIDVLDCRVRKDAALRERVAGDLARVLADPRLLSALGDLYRKLAQACR